MINRGVMPTHFHSVRVVLAGICVMSVLAVEAQARRPSLTETERQALEKIQRIQVQALVLTDQGQEDATAVHDLVAKKMEEFEYEIVKDPTEPSDAVLRVKCEQRKTWEGTVSAGGDADLPDSPSRVWRGPACQLRYLMDGKPMAWAKEVRTDFEDALKAANEAGERDPGMFAITRLQERLAKYEFPVFLTTEWGQEARLLKMFQKPDLTSGRKIALIQAFGELFAGSAVPHLKPLLKDPDMEVAKAAIIAVGNIGHREGIAMLVDVLQTGPPELQIEACRGLGKVGALHGDASVVPPLIHAMETGDIKLQTAAVWALGQLPDRRAYEPLLKLQASMGDKRVADRESPEGKLYDALHYTLKQIDGIEH
ncbi:MAG: HEAT repeat domain-containing protein [Nitrospiraceae bacterium]